MAGTPRARDKEKQRGYYNRYKVHSVTRGIVLDRDMVQDIKDYAAKERQSFSAAVRDLIEWAIEDHILPSRM